MNQKYLFIKQRKNTRRKI